MAEQSQEKLSVINEEKEQVIKTQEIDIPAYNWLKDASVFNKNFENISYEWCRTNADMIVLYFNAKGVKFNDHVQKFYEAYEDAKSVNLPIEVINIPMDDNEKDYLDSYEEQANWFTLKFNDNLITILVYMFGVTSIPHLMVFKVDGTVISWNGFLDFQENGKNAFVSWLSMCSSTKTHRKLCKETVYGPIWRYSSNNGGKSKSKFDIQKVFDLVQGFSSVHCKSKSSV